MRVTNLTESVQKLTVKPLTGEREEFDIFIQPKGFTDLNWKLSVDTSKYAGIFQFEGQAIPVTKKAPIPQVEVKEEIPVEESPKEEPQKEEEVKEDEPVEEAPKSDYVCEICGAEFGSERGLKAHMKKAHAE